MHELGIASSIQEAVEAEAAKRPDTRFLKVVLRIGELAGVDPDALTFGWEVITRETRLDGTKLDIEQIAWRNRCESCAAEFQVKDYQTQCPACGAAQTRCVSGEEMDIAYLEVEE